MRPLSPARPAPPAGPAKAHPGWALAVLVPALLLALTLTVSVRLGWAPVLRVDAALSEGAAHLVNSHPGVVAPAALVSTVLGPWPLRLAVVSAALVLARRGRPRLAGWAAATVLSGGVVGGLLKALVGRDRPEPDVPLAVAGGAAYPSGHALTAGLVAGVVAVLLVTVVRLRVAVRLPVLIGLALVAVAVGCTRVVLGVHWASDVVGGWLVALAWLAGAMYGWPPGQLDARVSTARG